MSERVLAALLASLALITGGCGGGSEPTAQAPATPGGATPSPSPAAQKPSVPAKPADAKDAKDAKGKPTNPAAKGPNGKSPAVAGGLTRSTDPDERAQEVQGRIKAGGAAKTDPFSALPVTPILKADSEGAAAGNSSIAKANGAAAAAGARAGSGGLTTGDTANGGTVPIPPLPPLIAQGIDNLPEIPVNIGPTLPPITIASLPIGGSSAPSPSGAAPSGSAPRGTSPQATGGGSSPRSTPGTTTAAAPLPPPIPALPSQDFGDLPAIPVNIGPPLPPPDLAPQSIAQNIGVSGVAQLGDVVQVIVQLPGGLTRYVGVGDLIANGQVLVKRVEGLGSSDPIVILEEEGVEYPRGLGAPVVAMDENSDRG